MLRHATASQDGGIDGRVGTVSLLQLGVFWR